MRLISVVIAMTVALNCTAIAQQPGDDTYKRLRKADRIIRIGVVMMVAGALIAPITVRDNVPNRDLHMAGGLSLVGAGMVVVWLGANERRRVLQPQTTVGIGVGRDKAVEIRRTW